MYIEDFPSHCGSRIFHQFYTNKITQWPSPKYIKTFFGIFVDDYDQRRTYNSLKEKFKILYQSPILVNPSTDREYFIVIWLNEQP